MSTLTRPRTTGRARDAVAGVCDLPDLPTAWAVAARRRIEQWLDAGMPDPALAHLTEAERRHRYTYVSYGDADLRGSPQLRRCLRYYIPHVREIVGPDVIFGGGPQIAPRFPGESGGPHIDGMGDENRMQDPMVPTAVLALYLSDVGPDDGALGVWPELLDEVHRYGRRRVADPTHDLDQSAYRDLMAQARDRDPTVLTGSAGRAYLLHGSTPHCNLPHAGPDVRHALFLRFYRRRHYPAGNDRPNRGRALAVLGDPVPAWACGVQPGPVSRLHT